MATYNSEQIARLENLPQKMVKAGDHGRKRCLRFDYTAPSALAANSVIKLVKVPADVRIVKEESIVYFSAFGSARTVDVGYQAHEDNQGNDVVADVDHYIDGVDVSSAGNQAFNNDTNDDGFETTSEHIIVATVLGGTMPSAGYLKGHVTFVQP